MNDANALHERGRALEHEFFHRVDKNLGMALRESMEREDSREQLSAATGLLDQTLLDHLLDDGFKAATLTALALVPSVFVAWADGSVTSQERQAVLSAALQHRLGHEPIAFQMIEGWLDTRPPRSLWNLWKEYVEVVHRSISPTLSELLLREIVCQATVVAEASGGILGFGKVSIKEQAILDEVTEMFS